ncbi:hypothetical protein, partial [Escherichia coli]|uniref:hypothetical protein n=1 Tax=Escherichia coli TaxID=562 RepID=UPI001BC89D05
LFSQEFQDLPDGAETTLTIFQRLTAKQSIKKHVFSSWTPPVHKAATNSPTASETLADLHTDKRQQ